jgi:DNA-binding NtrC family response regulator
MRILFADDEASLQELMRIELPRLGHEATVCPDGRTALAALDRTSYDCVIVDLDMPGAGGLDVIARVRQTSPDTETVIITGKSSVESAVTAVRQGVFDYLTKPCKLADIQAVLERARKKRESVAPVLMVGMTGTFPHSSRVMRSTGPITSGRSGDAGLSGRCDRMSTCTAVSAATRSSAWAVSHLLAD